MKKIIGFEWVMTLFGLMGGALALVPRATDSLGLSPDVLVNAPFKTFLIPGLFLVIVIAGGNLTTGLLLMKAKNSGMYLLGAMGVVLMLWIVVQCYMLWGVEGLHVVFFVLGGLQLVVAIRMIRIYQIPLPLAAVQH